MGSGPRRHFLSGPMGAGKSTVGRCLATLLHQPFFDLDHVIEQAAGRSITTLFAEEGEAGFRRREQAALDALLAAPPAVVALGGGTVVSADNRRRLRTCGHLTTLMAPLDVLQARLAGETGRPLLTQLPDLLAARRAAYTDADLILDTEGQSPEAVARAVLAGLAAHAEVPVQLGERSYPVIVAHRAQAERIHRLVALAETGTVLLVTDETVARLHGPPLLTALRAAGLRVHLVAVPAGEASKSLDTLAFLYDQSFAADLDRGTLVVALGGGVVGDLAGFLAATLLRGLPWVQLPTTLLAQVDSSVGGKTGINHRRGKNLIGAFHQPRLVFADTAWLETLPPREIRAGLAEAVKHAVIAEPALLDDIRGAGRALLERRFEALVPVVAAVVRIKAAIVAEDEHEAHRRKILNFGHTLAHALEGTSADLLHGEAVALGMACDLERSVAYGLPPADRDLVLAILTEIGLDVRWRARISADVLDMVAKDKKIRRQCLDDVVLSGLGRPKVESIPLGAWRQALARAGEAEEVG